MPWHHAFFLAASLLALTSAPPAVAEIYKWVDKNGVVNYGSEPPPGRSAKELPTDPATGISVVPAPPPPPTPSPRQATDERVEQLEKALAEEKAARTRQTQNENERRQAAIDQCKENRGVDCEQDPWQYDSTYAPPVGGYYRPHPIRPIQPPPYRPPPGKPRPPLEPEPKGAVTNHPKWPAR